MSTMHASKKAVSLKKKRRAPKKRRRVAATAARAQRRVAAGGIGEMIGNLRAYHSSLKAERHQLDERVAAIDTALAALGQPLRSTTGTSRRGGRGSGAHPGSLKDFLGRVLNPSRAMAVKDITAAVRKAGYKSKNKTLDKSVGVALADMKKVVRVGRGQYRLR
jgi:hypothetical protein